MAACVATLAACGKDGADAGSGAATPPPVTVQAAEGVQIDLHVPDSLAFGRAADVGATVANRSRAPVSGARLQVFIQSPIEPAPDSTPAAPGAPPAAAPTRTAAAGGTLLTWALGMLAPGQSAAFTQRVRLPASARPADTSAVALVVRATVVGADGRALGPAVEDTLHPPTPTAAACGAGDAHVMRYGVGGVRLGMPAEELRALCPGARDTAWTAEGTREKGIAFPLAGHVLLATLSGDTVARVMVRDSGLSTPAGVGVGSALGDLRARYGGPCAAMATGDVVVWFPAAPGIRFALGAKPPEEWGGGHDDPALLPDTTRVTRLWVRKGPDDCPAPSAGPTSQEGAGR
ncbi:MAG: hypothetical protein JWM27_2752 [Gemmatimonadetes bacterium]|nr:hypothetical protein [Gemmatimonadota bacterium]